MTNAEKYLKEGVDIDNLITEIVHDFIHEYIYRQDFRTVMTNFLKRKAKPALIEDERVILKNLHEEYKHIRRNEMGNLYVGVDYFGMYDELFQFIKNGEGYEIKELLGDEK